MFYCVMKGIKSLLQISSATFLPNIIKIGQRLNSYSENNKGELFLKHSVFLETRIIDLHLPLIV